jgi:hypothetical protein
MCNNCFNGMWCIEEQKVRASHVSLGASSKRSSSPDLVQSPMLAVSGRMYMQV